MKTIRIHIKSLTGNIPEYQTEESAACDLKAALDGAVTIEPGECALIPTGLFIEPIPNEGEALPAILIFARSGLSVKHGISLANGVGVVDADYRGEIKVALFNHSSIPYTVSPGDRIAQMMIVPTLHAEFFPVDELGETERGEGGFGHTGK